MSFSSDLKRRLTLALNSKKAAAELESDVSSSSGGGPQIENIVMQANAWPLHSINMGSSGPQADAGSIDLNFGGGVIVTITSAELTDQTNALNYLRQLSGYEDIQIRVFIDNNNDIIWRIMFVGKTSQPLTIAQNNSLTANSNPVSVTVTNSTGSIAFNINASIVKNGKLTTIVVEEAYNKPNSGFTVTANLPSGISPASDMWELVATAQDSVPTGTGAARVRSNGIFEIVNGVNPGTFTFNGTVCSWRGFCLTWISE